LKQQLLIMNYKKYLSFLNNTTQGQLLIEILVAIALSSILLPALLTGIVSSRSGKAQQGQRVQAVALMKESTEAVRSIREREWDNFATNGTYHPSVTGSEWTLTSGTDSVSGFTRSIVISDVHRDTNGVIVASPSGTLDPSTKKIDIAIAWTTPHSSSVNSTIYITRFSNTTFTHTTQADFTAGTTSGTAITNDEGGEVILGAGAGGNWCAPNLSITSLDLPKNGVANAITAIEGRVFAGTGDNASGVAFSNINITNTNPPVASSLGTFDGYKTNDIFGETNYGYIATDTNSKEIVILNLINSPYTEIGYFDAPGSTNANSVFVLGTKGYMTQGNNFRVFDLTSKIGSRSQLGSVTLAGTGTDIEVVGNYAYVSLSGSSAEVQIINISNSSNPVIVGQADVNGEAGTGIFTNSSGTRAYLVSNASSTQREMFIIDTTTKTGNRPVVGSYDASGMSPKKITVVTGNRAIIVGSGGEEYQIIDVSNEASPARCGGIQIDTGVNGIASVVESDGDAYSYIITGDASSELKIIEGGLGGGLSTSGTFTSRIFDASTSAAFNRIVPVFTQPNQTTVRFQVAVATPVSSSCTGALFSFVGPDGTADTYFTGEGLIPLITSGTYKNPERCFQYKLFLDTTDVSQTPIFNSMLVNYSP
jgi:type II secretory pathway pseudopilin PulG